MKSLTNSLARALSLPLVLLVIMITSCTPDHSELPPPGGGNGNGGGTNPPPAPSLTANFTQPVAWYGGSDTCIYSSETGAVVKMNGSSEVTSPIIFNNITSPISFRLTATKTVGGLTSAETIRDMYVRPYSQDTTNRCADLNLKGYGLWENTSVTQSTNGGAPVSVPALIDQRKYIYFPDGSRKNDLGGLSHYQMSNIGSDIYINLGDIGNPPNTYKQESLTSTTMVLSKFSTDGTVKFVLAYNKAN